MAIFVGLLPFCLPLFPFWLFFTHFQFFPLFHFLIYHSNICPPLDPPISEVQQYEDWGPGGSFKVCRIECEEGLKFSREVPEFYVCGAEGFWRPNSNSDDPRAKFTYPACSETKPAQKIFKIKLDYITDVLCNDAGKGVLKKRIIDALQELNKVYIFSRKKFKIYIF